MRTKLLTLSLLLLMSAGSIAQIPKDAFLKDHLERWQTSRQYMLDVAEKMPETEYGFKLTPEQSSFAEQLMHIAAIIDWHGFGKADGQEYKPRWEDFKTRGLTKREIINVLVREFDRATKLIAEFDPKRLDETTTYSQFTRTRRQMFMLQADHVTHHRAQLLMYLRVKGIVPPKYWEFQ